MPGWIPRNARDVRPGDLVSDCGGEAHEIRAVDITPSGEVVLRAADQDEQLSLITSPEHEVNVRRARQELSQPARANDFQRLAGEQGRLFEQQCEITLTAAGFEITRRRFLVPELGIEVDAESWAQSGRLWFQHKGSWLGDRPGTRRTDTAKKAICDAFLAWADDGPWPPMVLLTSHLPEPGSRSAQMLQVALSVGALHDVIGLYTPGATRRLRALALGDV